MVIKKPAMQVFSHLINYSVYLNVDIIVWSMAS